MGSKVTGEGQNDQLTKQPNTTGDLTGRERCEEGSWLCVLIGCYYLGSSSGFCFLLAQFLLLLPVLHHHLLHLPVLDTHQHLIIAHLIVTVFPAEHLFTVSCSARGAVHLPPHLHQFVQNHSSFAAHVVELLLLLLQHLLCALLPMLQQLLQLLVNNNNTIS